MNPPSTSAVANPEKDVIHQVVAIAPSETSSLNSYGDVFSVDGVEDLHKPIDSYEGRHRFDPTARWTPEEEKKLVRKLDWRICSWCCLMFFALQLDRGNISGALSDNFLVDLNMTTNDYNLGQTIFYLSFLCAELPSQLVSKKIGPDNWIPIQMVSWSIVACSQSRLTGKATFFVTRALLGLIEGGFIPDLILYFSYFYKSKELPVRCSFFWGAYISTFIVSAFLAFGILHLEGVRGWFGWQWLFVLEGALTAIIGVASWFYLPASPTQTKGGLRGKDGWFSEREEIIMVNRILRDDPGKGGMHNRQAVSWSLLWEALKDHDLWPIYLLGLTWSVPQTPTQAYLTLTLRNLGFGTLETNLLTIPAYTLFLVQLLVWTYLSEKWNNRMAMVLFCQVYMFSCLLALELLPPAHQWARYVLNTLIGGYPYVHAIIVALVSRNAGSVRTRTVGTALYNMAVQIGTIISSNIYRTPDAPYYYTGNKVLLGILAYNVVLIIGIKIFYIKRNAWKEAKWSVMNEDERRTYISTTTDVGNKRLNFRFAH